MLFWNSIGRLLSRRATPSYGRLGESRYTLTPYALDEALKCGVLATCVNTVAQGIGEVPISAPDDRELDLVLQRPNEWQSGEEFREAIAFDIMTHGRAFVRKSLKPDRRTVTRLAPWRPDEIRVEHTPGGMPAFYDRRSGDRLPASEMIMFRDVGRADVMGLSRVQSVWPSICIVKAANDLVNANFNRGINPGVILSGESMPGPDRMEAVVKMLREAFGRGGLESGGVAVLPAGVKYENVSVMKASDVDLRETRIGAIREICAAFGIPPFLGGAQGDTSYNNVTARFAGMYRTTFSPLVGRIRRTLELGLNTPIKADATVLLRGDLASLAKMARELKVAGILSANEARRWIGEDPSDAEGADDLTVSGGNGGGGEDDRRGEMPSDDGNMDTPPDRAAVLQLVKEAP